MSRTPGPWLVSVDHDVDLDTTGLARVYTPQHADVERGWISDYFPEEDARLIAAAPELLEALKAIVAVLQKEAPGTALNHHRYDAVGSQAHAAIAKAEGRS